MLVKVGGNETNNSSRGIFFLRRAQNAKICLCLGALMLSIDTVRAVEVPGIHVEGGADIAGLKVNETLILFEDGVYYGSKANLPVH